MDDLRLVKNIVFDISNVNTTYEKQDEYTEVISILLKRNYKIYIIDSKNPESLNVEEYRQINLFALNISGPLQLLTEFIEVELTSGITIWCTECPTLHNCLIDTDALVVTIDTPIKPFAKNIRIKNITELAHVLNPGEFIIRSVAFDIIELSKVKNNFPVIVGIGGPPTSKLDEFSNTLKEFIEADQGLLAETINLSKILLDYDDLTNKQAGSNYWKNDYLKNWFLNDILNPLSNGISVQYDRFNKLLVENFGSDFPLFIEKNGILILYSELLFMEDIVQFLNYSILFEMDSNEIIRRLYEFPHESRVDEFFTNQFLKKEGKIYFDYLEDNQVPTRVDRIFDITNCGY